MGNLRSISELYAKFSLIFFPCYAILSFAFNYMYFYVLGIDLEKIPLSSLDYIMSFNIFGLTLAVGLISQTIGLCWGVSSGEQECSALRTADEEIKQQYFNKENRERKIFLVLSSIIACLFVILYYNFGILRTNFVLIMPIIATIIPISNLTKEMSFILLIFLSLLSYTLNTAKSSAISNYNSPVPEIEINNNTYTIMRIFENGFLVKEKETKNILYITEQGVKINYAIPEKVIQYNEFINSK